MSKIPEWAQVPVIILCSFAATPVLIWLRAWGFHLYQTQVPWPPAPEWRSDARTLQDEEGK